MTHEANPVEAQRAREQKWLEDYERWEAEVEARRERLAAMVRRVASLFTRAAGMLRRPGARSGECCSLGTTGPVAG